mmetsp:Transcript_4971/g.13382  ORF Transcript_4971/g.13382 Transcript_4971/m.13382 type:complete len:924 (-) Transcript_4971:3280-6051(-)
MRCLVPVLMAKVLLAVAVAAFVAARASASCFFQPSENCSGQALLNVAVRGQDLTDSLFEECFFSTGVAGQRSLFKDCVFVRTRFDESEIEALELSGFRGDSISLQRVKFSKGFVWSGGALERVDVSNSSIACDGAAAYKLDSIAVDTFSAERLDDGCRANESEPTGVVLFENVRLGHLDLSQSKVGLSVHASNVTKITLVGADPGFWRPLKLQNSVILFTDVRGLSNAHLVLEGTDVKSGIADGMRNVRLELVGGHMRDTSINACSFSFREDQPSVFRDVFWENCSFVDTDFGCALFQGDSSLVDVDLSGALVGGVSGLFNASECPSFCKAFGCICESASSCGLSATAPPPGSPSTSPSVPPSATADATPSSAPPAKPSVTPVATFVATPSATPSANPSDLPSTTPVPTQLATPSVIITPIEPTELSSPSSTAAPSTVLPLPSDPDVPRPSYTQVPKPTATDAPRSTPAPSTAQPTSSVSPTSAESTTPFEAPTTLLPQPSVTIEPTEASAPSATPSPTPVETTHSFTSTPAPSTENPQRTPSVTHTVTPSPTAFVTSVAQTPTASGSEDSSEGPSASAVPPSASPQPSVTVTQTSVPASTASATATPIADPTSTTAEPSLAENPSPTFAVTPTPEFASASQSLMPASSSYPTATAASADPSSQPSSISSFEPVLTPDSTLEVANESSTHNAVSTPEPQTSATFASPTAAPSLTPSPLPTAFPIISVSPVPTSEQSSDPAEEPNAITITATPSFTSSPLLVATETPFSTASTGSGGGGAEAPSSSPTPVCIDAAWTASEHKGFEVHQNPVLADVYCYRQLPCATAGHVVAVRGKLVTMSELCIEKQCARKAMLVNGVQHRRSHLMPCDGDVCLTTFEAARNSAWKRAENALVYALLKTRIPGIANAATRIQLFSATRHSARLK